MSNYNPLALGGTSWAGWGAQRETVVDAKGQVYVIPVYTNALGANAVPDQALRECPVFSHIPDWLVGSAVLSQSRTDEMLAMGIPALTPSTGRTLLPTVSDQRQQDLNSPVGEASAFKPNGWPTEGHEAPDDGRWLHNDMKDVAHYYTHRIFERIRDAGGLK